MLVKLRAAGGHDDVGRSRRRQAKAVDIGAVKKVDAVDDDALLSRGRTRKHFAAVGDAYMLLNHSVARAGGQVITVAPNCGARVIGKERTIELIAVIRPHGVRPSAHCVTHCIWRVGLIGRAAKVGNNKEPSIGKLVIAHHRITAHEFFARATKAGEQRVGDDGTQEHFARRRVARTLPGVNCHARIDDLHNLIGADGETVVGGVPRFYRALRPSESHAEAIKAGDESGRWARSLRDLFHSCALGSDYGRRKRLIFGRVAVCGPAPWWGCRNLISSVERRRRGGTVKMHRRVHNRLAALPLRGVGR